MHEELSKTIGQRLSAIRHARDLTLKDMAERTGMSVSHIWALEQGRSRKPALATVVALSRSLGVSLDYLTGLTSGEPQLHPDALRIACEIDALLRRN